jgi:hypothetical protein
VSNLVTRSLYAKLCYLLKQPLWWQNNSPLKYRERRRWSATVWKMGNSQLTSHWGFQSVTRPLQGFVGNNKRGRWPNTLFMILYTTMAMMFIYYRYKSTVTRLVTLQMSLYFIIALYTQPRKMFETNLSDLNELNILCCLRYYYLYDEQLLRKWWVWVRVELRGKYGL